MAELVLVDTQKVSLSINPVDAKGNPAPVEGISWAVSDETILGIVVSDDQKSAVVSALGPLGVSQVSVSADVTIGDGVDTLAGTLDVTVVAGKASSLGITVGTPSEQ